MSATDRKKGVVLVMVLWVLLVLSVFALSLGHQTGTDLRLAGNYHREIILKNAAEKALINAWTLVRRAENTGKNPLLAFRKNPLPFSGDSWKYGLRDEESRININYADRETLMKIPGITIEIVEGILSITRRSSETGMKYPMFNNPEELFLIKGMTAEIYNNISPFITTYGSGRININTASAGIMRIAGLGESMVSKICFYRAGTDGLELTEDDNYIQGIGELEDNLSRIYGLTGEEKTGIETLYKAGKIGFSSSAYRADIYVEHSKRSRKNVSCVFTMEQGRFGLPNILCWNEKI